MTKWQHNYLFAKWLSIKHWWSIYSIWDEEYDKLEKEFIENFYNQDYIKKYDIIRETWILKTAYSYSVRINTIDFEQNNINYWFKDYWPRIRNTTIRLQNDTKEEAIRQSKIYYQLLNWMRQRNIPLDLLYWRDESYQIEYNLNKCLWINNIEVTEEDLKINYKEY